jgi:hypothetical protein
MQTQNNNLKMSNKPIILLIIIILFSNLAMAEKSQQYNQINLEPYYRTSLTANINYDYNVNIAPPDGFTETISAIIRFKNYMNPAINYNLTINGASCNPNIFQISTTYSGASQADISFDCSNLITSAGNYTIRLRTDKNTGSIYSFLDFTYINNPSGTLKVFGTEYQAGDLGKMFLQFLDADKRPVSNSECFLTIWHPDNTLFVNNTLMSKLDNASEGIFYHNVNIPNITGVYPSSAKCYRPLLFNNILVANYTTEGFEGNNWTGGTGWATCNTPYNCTNGWDIEDTIPLSTIVTNASAGCYAGGYCAKTTGSYGWLERGINIPYGTKALNITYYAKFKGLQTNEHFDFFVFDGNWHLLEQIGSASQYGGYTNNVWYKHNIYIDDSTYEFSNVLIGWFATSATPSTGDEFYVDNIYIDLSYANATFNLNDSQYEILRGSGEIHVSNYVGAIIAQINNLSSQINNLNYTVSSQISNLQTLIEQNSNLTTEQYNNITSQINILENNLYNACNNITTQINNLNISALINNTNDLLLLSYQINQTTTQTYAEINQLNNTMNLLFAETNNLIYQTYLNLTNQINNLNFTTDLSSIQNNLTNLQNITTENQNWLIQIWNYIQGLGYQLFFMNQTLNNINETTTENQNLLNQLLNQTATFIYIYPNTNNCITGSDWILQASVVNDNAQIMTDTQVNCTQSNDVLGNDLMDYIPALQKWEYRMTCPNTQSWNWSISCIPI